MPRRALVLLLVAAAVGAPAALLRALCIGNSCDRPESASADVPFCSLPAAVREPLARGFREGRSPDIMAVSRPSVAIEGPGGRGRWPSTGDPAGTTVPIVFAGTGVRPGADVPAGTGLDDIAPTVAEIIDLHRPHPEVRSGRAVAGVAGQGRPRLVLEIAFVDAATETLQGARRAGSYLARLMRSGAGTLRGDTESLPVDAAASLTTIGTGGLPRQHGITGTLVRNDSGGLTEAWGPRAPVSVIAGLGDDLDQQLGQRPMIGWVGDHISHQGIVGGNWYVDVDRDDHLPAGEDPVAAATRLLRRGYGKDRIPDLLAVTLDGSIGAMDRTVRALVGRARAAARGSVTVVVTATGGYPPAAETETVPVKAAVRVVERGAPGGPPVIEGVVAGGMFADQERLAERSISEDELIAVLRRWPGSSDGRAFADAFPAVAVSFARYC